MLGQIAQPQTPKLLVKLPFRRIAVLIEGFQITEDACEFLAGNAESFGIHGVPPFPARFVVVEGGSGDFRVSVSNGGPQWYALSTWREPAKPLRRKLILPVTCDREDQEF